MPKQNNPIKIAMVVMFALGCVVERKDDADANEPMHPPRTSRGPAPDMPPSVYDHITSELHDPELAETRHLSTVQLVKATNDSVEYDASTDTFRFATTTMGDLRRDTEDVAQLCDGIWNSFRSQPILEGRSGVLLAGSGAPVILTSAHGDNDLSTMYVIIARTFSYDVVEGRLVVPASHVRRPTCVLDCRNAGSSDWLRLQLEGARSGPWNGGLKLARSVASTTTVIGTFHPLGLPVKISDPAEVEVSISGTDYFIAVDYAPGASGGPLLDQQGDIAGIVRKRESWHQRKSWRLKNRHAMQSCIRSPKYRRLQFMPSQAILTEINRDSTCPLTHQMCPEAGATE